MHIEQSKFEQLVAEAIDALPPAGQRAMENVVFIVEPEAREAKSKEMNIKRGRWLLGLYEGVSKPNRGSGYFAVLPDKITIFERPIKALAGGSPARLREIVFDVVRHEVGHHLGFDEPGIRANERARRAKRKD